MWGYAGGGWGPWMLIFPLIFFVLFVGFMMFFMRGMGSGCGRSGVYKDGAPREDAKAILDRRYASGEINREEWERMRQDLTK